jgi:ubiquinone/menaquinone biosynthesis C-methylase UbiE
MAWDSIWDNVHQNQEWGKYPGEDLIRFVARNFYSKDRKNTRILEIGCGQGANIWYLSREAFDSYGIDGSRISVEKAENRLAAEGLKSNLSVGDISSLTYEDNFFDAVIDIECLYCNSWYNSEKILAEIKRVLKKEGLFYSKTISDDFYLGENPEKTGFLEYNNISDGPLAGKGFARLTDFESIGKLYGKFFKIVSVDKLEYSRDNQLIKVSEWLIVCQK